MKIFANVLPEDHLDSIQKEFSELLKKNVWQSSRHIWGEKILQGVSGSCLITATSNDVNMLLRSCLKDKVPKYRELSTKFYVWEKSSGIATHRDGVYEFGATIYLNRDWDMNFGGILLYEESDGWRAHNPAYNSMVVNDSKQNHMVTQVSPLAPQDRYTLQIFGA
jgi:Rps23 Pro-64 3,4-dihydroxylase Tpa1-like proline 4-hydroxylase